MSESLPSIPPKQTGASKLRFYGLLAGMVTALAGTAKTYFTAKEETIARDSYRVNVALIARLSDESQRNHEDIKALREYLDKHITGTTASACPAASAPLADKVDYNTTLAPPPPVVKPRAAVVKVKKAKSGEPPPAPPAALTVVDKNGDVSTITVPDEWP